MSLTQELSMLGSDPDYVLEELAVPIYLVDADGVIRWQNRASIALTGDMRGTRYDVVVVPEHRDAVDRRLSSQTRPSGSASEYSVVIIGANGRRMRVRGTSQPLWVGERFAGMFGVVTSASDDEHATQPDLSARQLEVLTLLAAGRSTEEIAISLNIAVYTARNHIRRLFQHLGVHSRIEAVARGRELSLL